MVIIKDYDSGYIFKYNSGWILCLNKLITLNLNNKYNQKANSFRLCKMSKNNFLVMHFSWFPLSMLWKLWADTPTANFNTHLNKQHVIWSGRKHSPLASYSFHGDHSLLFPSWESVNSEWTWDDSYKLFPNLVISHFHAVMDIGLQVWWECREEEL